MKKAFIFDMDGVIVDSQRVWLKLIPHFLQNLGIRIPFTESIGHQFVGVSMKDIYKLLCEKLNYFGSYEEFMKTVNEFAEQIYAQAEINPELEGFMQYLHENDFKIGLVSSSPQNWVDQIIKRVQILKEFDLVSALNDRKDIEAKPAPDGYIEAMKKINVTAGNTVILEDSNSGITAAKSSGAHTIAYTSFIADGYKQENADYYVESFKEIHEILVQIGLV